MKFSAFLRVFKWTPVPRKRTSGEQKERVRKIVELVTVASPVHYAQPSTSGELYRPKNLSDVVGRARQAGAEFKMLFNLD